MVHCSAFVMYVQELVDLAEPLRQNEVSKSVLKQILWTRLLDVVRQLPESTQTTAIPDAASTKKKAKEQKQPWEPDDIWKFISLVHPGASEMQIEAEQVVEEHCVKFFADLEGDLDPVLMRRQNQWHVAIKDHLIWIVCVLACRFACPRHCKQNCSFDL